MYHEISLSDIETLIQQQAKVNVHIQQQEKNHLLVHYGVEMKVELTEAFDDALLFHYQLGSIAKLVSKGAAKMLGNNIRTKKLNWDTEQQQIRLNLAVFGKFKPLFQNHKIQAAIIEDNKVKLHMVAK